MVRVVLSLLLATAALVLPATAHAKTTTIDFDGLTAGTKVTNQFEPSAGVHFDAGDIGSRPVVRAQPGKAHSGTNVAVINECDPAPCGEGFFDPTVLGRLNNSATAVSLYVGRIDDPTPYTASVHLTAYDANNAVVAQTAYVTVTAGQPYSTKLEVTSQTQNITSFILQTDPLDNASKNSPVAFDDLAITVPDPDPGTPPPPPDFGLAQGDGIVDLLQGEQRDVAVDLSRINASTGDIAFAVSGLPEGMTATFDPAAVGGTATHTTMHFAAAAGAAASTPYSTVTITATPSASAGATPRSITKLARISENCDRTVRFQFVDARSDGCMRKIGHEHTTVNQDVRVNGLILKPLDGDRVLVIDDLKKTIKSTASTYAVAVDSDPDIPFYYGPISWSFAAPPPGNGVSGPTRPGEEDPATAPRKVLGLDISGVQFLHGLPISGLSVKFTQGGKALVTPTLRLGFFPFNYFGEISASPTFTTDNDHGADFSGLEIKVAKVTALGIELKDVDLRYQSGGTWSGSAKLVLHFANTYTVGAGFGIKNGGFDFLRADVDGLNVPIGAGVYLQRLGAEVHRNPLTLTGQIGLSAGPIVAGVRALSINGGVTAVLSDPFIIEIDGDAKLADRFKLASAFVRYSSSGYFELGGSADWNFRYIYVKGAVSGWFAGLHAFDLEGSLSGCISIDYFPDPCAGAKAIISSIGVAGCVNVLGLQGGAGFTWGGDFDAFGGCDFGPYRPAHPANRAVGQVAGSYIVGAGLPSVAWSLDGDGGSPGVTVSGPHGETVTVSQANPYVSTDTFLAGLTESGSTFVLVKKPAAGAWTITPDATFPVTQVRQASGLPEPRVSARVVGLKRGRRQLRWSLAPIEGQTVQFAESGKDVRSFIATSGRRRGLANFTPAAGPGGTRKIVALVRQDGRPRATLTVASYTAPAPRRPGLARALKARRKGTRLIISWRPRVAGFRHAVYFKLSDRRELVRIVGARAHTLVLTGVPKSVTAKVTVTGLTAGNAKGPVARLSVKRG